MKMEELHVGQPVRIADNHPSTYGGRVGKVVTVGTLRLLDDSGVIEGAEVDIHEPFLILVAAEDLEQADINDLLPGWDEFEL